jgi:flagellar basal-body rod protein FlgG
VATEKLFTQGGMVQTDNAMDVAIKGRGFFQILMPDGNLGYTRDGTFQQNSEGELVTASGYVLQPSITIPDGAQSVTIGTDGVVSVQLAGQAAPSQVGSLETVDFINPVGLQPIGENLYLETASSGTAQAGTPGLNGFGTLVQGALEGSNVNVVSELVNMIETQRAYEMNSKAISTNDQMMQYLNNNL